MYNYTPLFPVELVMKKRKEKMDKKIRKRENVIVTILNLVYNISYISK